MPDLRRTCLHEYAHLAVARNLGVHGFVTIARVRGPTGTPSYVGRFQLHGDPSDEEWRLVALAGAVAELLIDDRQIDGAEAFDRIAADPSFLTGVDACLAKGFCREDVACCLAIVRRSWAEIENEAAERSAALLADHATAWPSD